MNVKDMANKLNALAGLFLILSLALFFMPVTYAEDYRWQVNHQHVILDINKTGSVAMSYDIDATIVKGTWYEVWIPLSTKGQKVVSVVDGSGNQRSFMIDGGQVKIQGFDLKPGDNIRLTIYSTIYPFVYKSDVQGYDIVTFVPIWWDMYIDDTRVKFYLPGNVPVDKILTGKTEFSNTGVENGQTWVYFEADRLSPNQQFPVAVAFPDSFMDPGAVTSSEGEYMPGGEGFIPGIIGNLFSCGCPAFLLFFVLMMVITAIAGISRRSSYSPPVVSMDGIGVNKSLDAVEAATLLRADPKRVMTMIMFGMMKKGNIKLISTDPIRLDLVSRKELSYYEKLFADSIRDERLDEDRMLECFKVLARRVVDKTRPYCRKDTEEYYMNKISESWDDIKALETPQLKFEKYDESMIWLMADEQFKKKTDEYITKVPGSDRIILPDHYWWYPYYYRLPPYYGGERVVRPETARPPEGPGPVDKTTATVENFANSISNSVETFSAGVITGVERFLGVRKEANAPPPASAVRVYNAEKGGRSSCACVSCACACVSCACACACAGGGGGCT
jgi:hypothetical protein